MKKLLRQLRQWAALKAFNRFYGHLVFGFETADTKIDKFSETEKTIYYESITNWVESEAYALENKGKIEDCYKKLATEAVGDDILTAYRLALLMLKNQDVRLRKKVQQYKDLQVTKNIFNNINK